MSKPIVEVKVTTAAGQDLVLKALFDTGSFYTIARDGVLPAGTPLLQYAVPKILGTAGKEGRVTIHGATDFTIAIGNKMINTRVLISRDLKRDLLIGAETMQAWDISILIRAGKTEIQVGHDMRDPEITEVD
ncbi:MAG: hypothetical protein HY360_27130 [Verrucomicrobia bacterium]|nr:hypothetical protein [Verrucomicrobiota bacterium]